MAYMGRGGFPSIGGDNDNKENLKALGCGRHRGPYFYRRFYYYIPLDNTYVIFQMIVTFIILIVGAITYIFTYKSTIIDPIESTKKLFINAYLIIIAIFLITTFIIHYISKDENILLKRLLIIGSVSMITMLVFGGIKFSLDNTYTKDKFKQIYTEQNVEESLNKLNVTDKFTADIGFTGVKIQSKEEYYISESVKLFDIFKTKAMSIIGLHLLLNILLTYQIVKVIKIKTKKDKLNKDDIVLFDEEENIKI